MPNSSLGLTLQTCVAQKVTGTRHMATEKREAFTWPSQQHIQVEAEQSYIAVLGPEEVLFNGKRLKDASRTREVPRDMNCLRKFSQVFSDMLI